MLFRNERMETRIVSSYGDYYYKKKEMVLGGKIKLSA